MQLEGQIIGFDEYMNMVLDDAVEIGKKRTEVGRILLKGDAITLIQEANPVKKEQSYNYNRGRKKEKQRNGLE